MENVQDYLEIAGLIIAVASAIAAVTPNQTDNKIMKIINSIALNVGNAKNKK